MRAAQTMLTVRVKEPFNLRLSLAGAASFLPIARTPEVLTEALDVGSIFAVVTVSQALRRLSSVHASSTPEIDEASLKEITEWLVWSDLDLRPFYRLARIIRPCVRLLEALQSCGLSRRKAEYVKKLASSVTQGALDFDALKLKRDDRIREELLAIPGFSEWSVNYMLSRGFGRADALAVGDMGLQRVLGN